MFLCFFFKQKAAYEIRIRYWSSDVCSSDLSIDEPFRETNHPTSRAVRSAGERGVRYRSQFADTEGDGGTTPFPGPACERAEPATRTVCPFRLSHIRFAGEPCRLSRQGGRDSRAGTPRCPTARRTAKRQ